MAQQLTEILKYFLEDYIPGKKEENGKNAAVWKSICHEAPEKMYETGLIDKNKYLVSGSVGKGVWAKVPWLAVFRREITESAQKGVYIVYLLSSDGNSLYLTLNQGVTEAGKDSTANETIKALRNNAARISAQLNKHNFSLDENINLGNDITDLGKKYQKGTIFYKKYSRRNIPSEDILREDLKNMLDVYEEYYDKVYKGNSTPSPEPSPAVVEVNMTKQKIFFGAPGTGKSFKVNEAVRNQQVFRTTFHPDYDYAQFVGAYKPKKVQCSDDGSLSEEQLAKKLSEFFSDNEESDKTSAIVLFGLRYANSLNGKTISEIVKHSGIGEEQYKKANLSAAVKAQLQFSKDDGTITYSFVPQVFAKAYAAAWKQYFAAGNVSTADNQVYLVIEEINRGNCAQIFGDIFQLLDRDREGFSQYSIDADCDFAEWLKDNGVGDGKLKLPPNLNILATMNTSDQSLFPMDSAFKRRFDWEYVPISFTDEKGNEKEAAKYEIDVPDANGKNYLWKNFVEAVNDKILDLTESEDKQLGEFFIKPDNGNVISKERFLGKVMFYLWNEVCKDEHKNGSFFRAKINDKEDFFTFQDLYKKKDLLKLFMDGLLEDKPTE